jgi:hypothetical protein
MEIEALQLLFTPLLTLSSFIKRSAPALNVVSWKDVNMKSAYLG